MSDPAGLVRVEQEPGDVLHVRRAAAQPHGRRPHRPVPHALHHRRGADGGHIS